MVSCAITYQQKFPQLIKVKRMQLISSRKTLNLERSNDVQEGA